tara:strand:+ start:270 stop:410 length:141 start_codon:yes stop_codon:yes gene_type:complete
MNELLAVHQDDEVLHVAVEQHHVDAARLQDTTEHFNCLMPKVGEVL